MSDEIFLSYKEQKKSASTPKNYSELKKIFFSLFNIDEKEIDSISFKYTNSDGDEILIDEDSEKSFEKVTAFLWIPGFIYSKQALAHLNKSNSDEV